MLISRSVVTQYLSRPLDSWLWVKKASREQLEEEVRRLKVPPAFKTRPWDHQMASFLLGYYNPYFLFLLEMGLGKSKIILDLLTQFRREKRVKRPAVIFVPRRANLDSWEAATLEHSDLEPHSVYDRSIEAKREALLDPRGDLIVIDYQGAALALSKKLPAKGKRKASLVPDPALINRARRNFDFAAYDEIHKLGDLGSLWYQVAMGLSESAQFAYGATGTLFNRDVRSVYSIFALLDGGETFGTSLPVFQSAFMAPKRNHFGTEWVFDESRLRVFNKFVSHRSIRYDDFEVHDLPPVLPQVRRLRMPPQQREQYLLAVQGLINADGNLVEQGAKYQRMRQIAAGYMVWSDDLGQHRMVFDDQPKLDALDGIIDETEGMTKVVVVCHFVETGAHITEHLKKRGVSYRWLYGSAKDGVQELRDFLQIPSIRVLVMNSESGGTGVDGLQRVSSCMVFYETPTSPTPRKQVVKRVSRPGQTAKHVRIVDLAMRGSVDMGILDDLEDGIDFYERVMSGRAKPGSLQPDD